MRLDSYAYSNAWLTVLAATLAAHEQWIAHLDGDVARSLVTMLDLLLPPVPA
jgi:MftR C-terminal domain